MEYASILSILPVCQKRCDIPALYGIDKYKAKKGQWRISEATLLTMATIGGSIGAWIGMRLWHHKTMHKKLKHGIPVIIILQVTLVAYLNDCTKY